jgi:outer membrane usher protein
MPCFNKGLLLALVMQLQATAWAQAVGAPNPTNSESLFKQTFGQRKQAVAQLITLPVMLDGRELGVLRARVGPEGVDVDRKSMAEFLQPILQPHVMQKIKPLDSVDVWLPVKDLSALGFEAPYSAQRLSIELVIPMDLRQNEAFSLNSKGAFRWEDGIRPEPWSLILNTRGVLSQQTGSNANARQEMLYADMAGRWQNWVLEDSVLYGPSFTGASGLTRQLTRLVRDWDTQAVRLTLGDVSSASHGSASALALGGLVVSRQFALNPAMPVQSQPGTSFQLPQGASVDVRVNGVLTRTLRLDPGVYSLSDIPVFTGANRVDLTIVEPGGKTVHREFDYFFDASLLKPQVHEFEFALGSPVVLSSLGRQYDTRQVLASAWWRRGWLDSITAGLSLQRRQGVGVQAHVAGAEAVWATPVGNFSGWLGQSRHTGFGGHTASLQWRWNRAIQAEDGASGLTRGVSWVLQASQSSEGYAPIHANQPGMATRDLGLRLGVLWTGGYSSNFGVSRRQSANPADSSQGFSASIRRWMGQHWSLDGAISQQQGNVRNTAIGLSLSYSADRATERQESDLVWQTRASYQSQDQRKQWDADLAGNTSWLGSDTYWQANASQTQAQSGEDTTLRARALMGRAEGIVSMRQSQIADVHNTLVEVSLASALVMSSGGGWGWAAPVYDSAVQFKPYKGFDGLRLLVDPQIGRTALSSDPWGTPPLASLSAWVPRQLQLDIENLPPGLSLGSDRPLLLPAYRSVLVVPVGSNARTQVTGRLLGPKQMPAPLHTLLLTQAGASDSLDLFTNRKGMFMSSQLTPGAYELSQPGSSQVLARFVVGEETEGIMDIGIIQMSGEKP